ncbi:MAG: hypothetical protein H0X12_08065 [Nocardioides sp.]|nr:hypothetical protein [Nocardioides sp.]
MSHDPGHPGAVDDGWRPGSGGTSGLDWVRTGLAGLIGLIAVALLSVSWLLVVAAVHVTSPDHPGRVAAVALAVPQLRDEAAESLVSDVEEKLERDLQPAERQQLVRTLDDVLASAEVERSLIDLRVVDGTLDARPFLAVVSDQLNDRAEQSAATGDAAAVLEQLATGATSPEVDRVGPMDEDITSGLESVRRLTLGAAVVAAVPAVIAALICIAIARRRGRTVMAVISGSLLGAALALTPAGSVLGDALGPAVTTVGSIAGSGTVWTLVLAALVAPTVLVAVRARRGQRESSTITS